MLKVLLTHPPQTLRKKRVRVAASQPIKSISAE